MIFSHEYFEFDVMLRGSISFFAPLFIFCTAHRPTVAPMVEQFVFPQNLTRGKRLRVICTVTEGDLPIDVQWKLGGIPIRSESGVGGSGARVTVRRIDQYTSLLAISDLDTSHAGNYSCVAKNRVAEHVRSATLTIRGSSTVCRV